jgi:hypothetical protein
MIIWCACSDTHETMILSHIKMLENFRRLKVLLSTVLSLDPYYKLELELQVFIQAILLTAIHTSAVSSSFSCLKPPGHAVILQRAAQ